MWSQQSHIIRIIHHHHHHHHCHCYQRHHYDCNHNISGSLNIKYQISFQNDFQPSNHLDLIHKAKKRKKILIAFRWQSKEWISEEKKCFVNICFRKWKEERFISASDSESEKAFTSLHLHSCLWWPRMCYNGEFRLCTVSMPIQEVKESRKIEEKHPNNIID